jgi:MFS family permease
VAILRAFSLRPGMPERLSALLGARPMVGAQFGVIALCIVVNMMDGFEIFLPSFTAPQIARQWLLTPSQVGTLFSSGPIGMILGALALAPLADWWGRRRLMTLCLLFITAGMVLSAQTRGAWQLMATRLLAGMGVGAMLAVNNTIVAEYANDRWRDLVVCLQAAGVPLGASLGGLSAYWFADVSWRWVFAMGGACSALLIVAVVAWLPESLAFLLARRPRGALQRLNALLRRLHMDPVDTMPAETRRRTSRGPSPLASGNVVANTMLICASCFFLMFTFYFLTNWMPSLLTDYGLSVRTGISAATFMNLGGVVGDLAFACFTIRWSARRLGPVFMAACFLTVLVFAIFPVRIESLTFLSLLLGFLLFGSMASIYAMLPMIFPVSRRTSGTGLTLGVGRIGAAAGPYVGGLLIAIGWHRTSYLLIMAVPLLLSAAGIVSLANIARSAVVFRESTSIR